jgi:hypothetical protein
VGTRCLWLHTLFCVPLSATHLLFGEYPASDATRGFELVGARPSPYNTFTYSTSWEACGEARWLPIAVTSPYVCSRTSTLCLQLAAVETHMVQVLLKEFVVVCQWWLRSVMRRCLPTSDQRPKSARHTEQRSPLAVLLLGSAMCMGWDEVD